MTSDELQQKLYEFIRQAYPDINIQIGETDDGRRSIHFVSEKFKELFPRQRYHYLAHLIPAEFHEQYLAQTVWFELAPGEVPADLDYHHEETIEEIKDIIFKVLDAIDFAAKLNASLMPEAARCEGDFRHSKKILSDLHFSDEEQFDVFHVLMSEGGYCYCEILYNIFRDSEFAKKYWNLR